MSDLPVAGRRVVIAVRVRRSRCVGPDCRTRIFAERLGSDFTGAYARRTARLDCIEHHLGLALGGRPAACFARRLMVPAIRDTLLRTVRRLAVRPVEPPSVIGIDDWAFRRGQRHGTLVCVLERRRIVALLPDRESGTVEAWLAARFGITVVARDRGGCYGDAVIDALARGAWRGKTRNEIRSSGYVVHTLEAALWAVGTTASFEDALILAVNLADAADTVGAVTGLLAGALYGASAIPERWLQPLAWCDRITAVADLLCSSRPDHPPGDEGL